MTENPRGKPKEVELLTSAGKVFFCIIDRPGSTLLEIANRCQITERSVFKCVRRLEQADFVASRRSGRRKVYIVNKENVRQIIEAQLGSLIEIS